MSNPFVSDATPRVWIGCLACYNHGLLVGDWYDATDAGDITVAQVHHDSVRTSAACEELWCFDHENLPVHHELCPTDAARWGELINAVLPHQRPAFFAWVESGDYLAEADEQFPCVSDFDDRYQGEWDSFDQYARDLADDVGLLDEVPDHLTAYFGWDAWIHDLTYDYAVIPVADGHGVYVFANP